MTHPVIETSAGTNGTSATTAPVVNLPSGIVSGDLLVALHHQAATGTVTWPGGWTELVDVGHDNSLHRTAIAWRRADGTEGASITLGTSNGRFASRVYRISGAEDPTVQPPQLSSRVIGNFTTGPDPASLTPTGGAKDYLWLWLGSFAGEATNPPAGAPTNYGGALGSNSGTVGSPEANAQTATAHRSLTAASEDPPSWTLSVTAQWTAYTMAVHPLPDSGVLLLGGL